MIYESVCRQARAISSSSLATPISPQEWEASVQTRRMMWHEMLGLLPMPERTPLEVTITGVLDRGDYVVEKLHYQSLPGAHVAGNLYRPAQVRERLPAVLYLCGHSLGKVNPTYQAHPRWFGQHGYVALVLDPIQLGECQGVHHGTYHLGRWDWYSRGYTPAGTEVWNAVRALDYLQSREDVDPQRLGVTGLSGGGVISWCLGAADERVKCVVPVCQTGTLEHLVVDRATDGHCDCAFWINYYRWCTPDLGALIAPRALLIAAGTEDVLWRPYAFRDAAHRIRHQYAALGVPDNVALVEDLTPHGYTPRLNRAIFQWFERHLKGKSPVATVTPAHADDGEPPPVSQSSCRASVCRPLSTEPLPPFSGADSSVEDDVTDYVEPAENLLVFGGSLPAEDRMAQVDRLVVHKAQVPAVTDPAQWQAHQAEALARLRSLTFQHIPSDPTPSLRDVRADGANAIEADGTYDIVFGTRVFETADGLTLRVRTAVPGDRRGSVPFVVCALAEDARSGFCGGGASRPPVAPSIATAVVEVRNTGATSVGPGYLWTLRRTYPLLGQTLPERQVYDLLAGVALMRADPVTGDIALFGQGRTAVLAIYAALLDPHVREVILAEPPETHEDPASPELLGVLRIGDLPHNLALLYPRPITFVGAMPQAYRWTAEVYEELGCGDRIAVVSDVSLWQPAEC